MPHLNPLEARLISDRQRTGFGGDDKAKILILSKRGLFLTPYFTWEFKEDEELNPLEARLISDLRGSCISAAASTST